MQVCASRHRCVCLWVVNQRPYAQGCTELIADPSSVAHLKQNKKYPHQKKHQQREFLKCIAALCTSKKPTSATNTRLKSSANNGRLQKEELRAKRLEREMRGNRLASFTLKFPAFHAQAVPVLSATHLYSILSGVEAKVPTSRSVKIRWIEHSRIHRFRPSEL